MRAVEEEEQLVENLPPVGYHAGELGADDDGHKRQRRKQSDSRGQVANNTLGVMRDVSPQPSGQKRKRI